MPSPLLRLALVAVLALPTALPAQAASPFADDPVRVAVEQFLRNQNAGLPGKVTVQVLPPSGGRAPACEAPEPFLPSGKSGPGRVSVGVRCGGERPWTRYLQAQVSVQTTYYVAARALGPGEVLAPADLAAREGDLATLPRTVVTDPAQVTGTLTANRIAAGSPVRTDLLRQVAAVRQGQNVTVLVEGDGFRISGEGKALADAPAGSAVQVRMRGGQAVSAVVRGADTVVLRP